MSAPNCSIVLETVNAKEGTSFEVVRQLPGGLQGGAWLISDPEGHEAVLKWTTNAALIQRRSQTIQLVEVLIQRGYPTSKWMYSGIHNSHFAYVVAEYFKGSTASWSNLPLEKVMDAIELHADAALPSSNTWSDYVLYILKSEDGPRGIVAELGQQGWGFLSDIDSSLPKNMSVRLPVGDAVHGDLHVGNILIKEEEIAIVDIDACGPGTRVIDYAWLLRDAWTRGAGLGSCTRIREQGERVAGHDIFQLCLAASCLDLVDFVVRKDGATTALPHLRTLRGLLRT